ncbi:MAG: hypothetical protein SPL00_05340 [Bacilli bacterium]|nr:hypothetical protein [Bacilli bacterium]
MENEELKNTENEVVEEEDEGFSDFKKEEPVVESAKENKEEEKEEEPAEEEETPDEEQDSYEYPDQRLEAIEEARIAWYDTYKKKNRVKISIFVGILLLMLAGWILPTTLVRDMGMLPLYIALGMCAILLVILALVSTIFRRSQMASMNEYFNSYYSLLDDYVFDGLEIQNIEGDIDCKITIEEFQNMYVYSPVAQVGSRNNINFTYKGMGCALADVAAEKDVGKGLQTIYVGKFLRCENKIQLNDENGLVIYFKGNKKALPPEGLKNVARIEEKKNYSVYGVTADRKVLTKVVKDELGKFKMTALLCDVTIVIRSGRTFIGLGYDDPLMILPSQKPFNPKYSMEFKEEFKQYINFALMLNQ